MRFLFGHLNFTSKREKIPYFLVIFFKLWITYGNILGVVDENAETQVINVLTIDFNDVILLTNSKQKGFNGVPPLT